jgi:hypothetical protein
MGKIKKIRIKEEFGINDIGNEQSVNEIIDKIDIKSNKLIELNMRHCLIDYPATANLIDRILYSLSKLEGEKVLFIVHDYVLPKITLLNWLFLGSKFFKIEKERELPQEKLEKLIKEELKKSNISIEISICNRAGESRVEYKYGK